jgi:hypothetical protein
MWFRAVRAFVITSLVLNAVGDLVEAEGPVIHDASAPDAGSNAAATGPLLHIIRQRGEPGPDGAVRPEGLEAFRSER